MSRSLVELASDGPSVVGPRYSVGIRDLDLARHCPRPLVREGALSYRDIPSLMGSERIAHGAMASDRATGGQK